PQDGHFGRRDDGREADPSDTAEVRDAEVAALHLFELELAVTGLLGQLGEVLGQLDHALLVGVFPHRHQETGRSIDGHADVYIPLADDLELLYVDAGVEVREALERYGHDLEQYGRGRQLGAGLFGQRLVALSELLELGDVGLIEVRDHGNGAPGGG